MTEQHRLTQEAILYRYRIKSLGESSAKYGPCEVCSKSVSEVFHQVESRKYVGWGTGEDGWTHYECTNLFGHEDCLKGKQRNNHKAK